MVKIQLDYTETFACSGQLFIGRADGDNALIIALALRSRFRSSKAGKDLGEDVLGEEERLLGYELDLFPCVKN